jgi:hypothetical protein
MCFINIPQNHRCLDECRLLGGVFLFDNPENIGYSTTAYKTQSQHVTFFFIFLIEYCLKKNCIITLILKKNFLTKNYNNVLLTKCLLQLIVLFLIKI